MAKDLLDDNFETPSWTNTVNESPVGGVVVAMEQDTTADAAHHQATEGKDNLDGGHRLDTANTTSTDMEVDWHTSQNEVLIDWSSIIRANQMKVDHSKETQIVTFEAAGGMDGDSDSARTEILPAESIKTEAADIASGWQNDGDTTERSEDALPKVDKTAGLESVVKDEFMTATVQLDEMAPEPIMPLAMAEDTATAFVMPKPPIRTSTNAETVLAMSKGFAHDNRVASVDFGQMNIPEFTESQPAQSSDAIATPYRTDNAQDKVLERANMLETQPASPTALRARSELETTASAAPAITEAQPQYGAAHKTATEAADQFEGINGPAPKAQTEAMPDNVPRFESSAEQSTEGEVLSPEQVRFALAEIGLTGLDGQTMSLLEQDTPAIPQPEAVVPTESEEASEQGERVRARVDSQTTSDALPEAQWQQHVRELQRLIAIFVAGRGPIPAYSAENVSFGYVGEFRTREELAQAVRDQGMVTAVSAVLAEYQQDLGAFKQVVLPLLGSMGIEATVDIELGHDSIGVEHWQTDPPSTISMTLRDNNLSIVVLQPAADQTTGSIGLDKRSTEIKQ